jgi:HTH-type transcriptional regulator/antitoxin HigA
MRSEVAVAEKGRVRGTTNMTRRKRTNPATVPTSAAVRPVSNTYRKLVAAFPLRAIRSDAELAAAHAVVEALLVADLDEDAKDYLDVLTDLVEKYECEVHPIPDVSEADMLRFLMELNQLSQPELAKKVGIAQSTISAVLNGNRSLTRQHIVKLAKFFNVSPAVFLPRG